ncbi:DMT family transporter [Pseudarthrobacter albicanus]|uniref:DMT family transporter n=1 Tax=Pseudarthrobacter albicanus TaxID=2823873 RepID=UPI001BA7DAD0|nr:DMT family transporter [Pseudarthrobacter albicanus]
MGIALSLAASLLWGTADFLAGKASRRLPLLTVMLFSQLAGLLGLVLVAAFGRHLDLGAVGWGVAAGVTSLGSLACFYRALAVGTMSIVAPIVATSAAVPVIGGFLIGERPGPVAVGGIVLALVGVVLASRQRTGAPIRDHRLSVGLAVAAAFFLGLQLVFLHQAGQIDALTGVSASRFTSVAVFALIAVVLRPAVSIRQLPGVALIGVLDTAANLAFTLATLNGALSSVAILSSLYPLVTVGLAYVQLHERLSRTQLAGVAAALTGVLFIVS